MATINTLPLNPSYLTGPQSAPGLNTSPQAASLVFAQPPVMGPVTNPVMAQGVTGLQSETAEEMTGGFPAVLDAGTTVTGAAGDGISAAGRGATAAAGGAADGARGAAAVAGGAVDGAQGAAAAAGGAADGLQGVARGAGRFLGPAAIGLDVIGGGLKIREAWNDKSLTEGQRDQKVGEATVGTAGSIAGGAGGAWAGAAAGAAIGSVVPVVGTAIGGIAGAVLGGFLGGTLGGKAGEAAGGTGAGKGIGGFINNLFGK